MNATPSLGERADAGAPPRRDSSCLDACRRPPYSADRSWPWRGPGGARNPPFQAPHSHPRGHLFRSSPSARWPMPSSAGYSPNARAAIRGVGRHPLTGHAATGGGAAHPAARSRPRAPPPPPLPHRPPPSARPHRRCAAFGVCAPGAARLARARLVRRSPRGRTPHRAAQVGGRRGSAGDRQPPSPLGGRGHGGGRRPPWGADTPSLTAPPTGRPADRPADGVAGGACGAPPGAAAAADAAAAARPRGAHPAMDAVVATAHDWPRCRRRCAGGRR